MNSSATPHCSAGTCGNIGHEALSLHFVACPHEMNYTLTYYGGTTEAPRDLHIIEFGPFDSLTEIMADASERIHDWWVRAG